MSELIAFIGVGNMGNPMAHNLMKAGKKAEKYMTKQAAGLDKTFEKAYKAAGVELAYMDQNDFNAWLEIAKKSSYKNFAEKVPGGQKLIDMALAVK